MLCAILVDIEVDLNVKVIVEAIVTVAVNLKEYVMKRPYIVCHMMSSVDGRIDCAMTEKLAGVEDYYSTLSELNAPVTVSGRVTAQLELASPGEFKGGDGALGHEAFAKNAASRGYEIVADTRGSLLWDDEGEMPRLILTSENADKSYLEYLNGRGISWIACGRNAIDLARACEILSSEFGVERMAVVGGGRINAGFLRAGLLDEVSLLIGPGIDGRGGMTAVFDGLPSDSGVYTLRLESVKTYASGAVWIRYAVKR